MNLRLKERKVIRNVIQKIILIGISVSILLASLSNLTVADHEQKNILNENLSNLITQNKTANEKLEQAVLNLIMDNNRFNNLYDKQINDFSFISEKVRLEVILTDEMMLDTLASFSNDIEIENHYKSLAQILIPINQINELSKKDYVQFIRSPVKGIPDVISEGVSVIGANLVQNAGFNGAGVKVAIIDFGFKGYTTDPDLPSSRIKEVTSFRADHDVDCDIDHGTACAEIVLDVAPLADLYLYNFDTISELNNAVSHAISVGINIISFSIGYTNINNYDGVGYSGVGDVCSIVNNARSHGILFVVAAGNSAKSHYEGTYQSIPGYDFHDFGSGDAFLDLGYLPTGTFYGFDLSWNDWPYSDQDYDLFLVDGDGDIVDYSLNYQTGSQPPTESMLWFTPYSDYFSIVIVKSSATQNVHLELYGFFLDFPEHNHLESSLTCPADTTGAMTVGATYWQNDNLESFSSRGPTNDGRTKPDVTAPDGVSTYTYGAGDFYGTSASAPHTAGAAALLKSVNSSLTANQLQTVLEATAVPLGTSGKDNLYGSGRIDVWNAFNSAVVNIPPVAHDDYYTTAEDTTRTVIAPGVLTNDTDGDGDTLTAVKVTNPSHGTVTSFPGTGAFVYVPTSNYYGTDSFTYKAYDGTVYSNIVTVHITVTSVNDTPVVSDIPSQTIAEGSTFTTINLDNYVSDVDNTDAEMTWTYSGNSQLTVSIVSRVATITIPNLNWSGAETITFRATDPGSLWDDDTATFTVTAVNDAPVVSGIPDQTIAEGSTFTTITLDNYVTDIDNTDAQMTWTYSGNSQLTVSIVARVATITIPNLDWNGAETITFRATDTGSLWDDDSAVFTVTAVNDPPVVTGIPDQTIAEGSTFATISLDNYVSDVDNTDAQMTWTYSGNTQLIVSIVNRVATISIPNVNWYGAETITFNATDPLGLWDTDPAVFTVSSVNDPPVANDDTATVTEDSINNQINARANDTDIEGDTLTIISVTQPSHGSSSTNGTFVYYTPSANYNGLDSFNYTVSDGHSGTDTATVHITVSSVNDAPVANFSYIPLQPTDLEIISFNDTSMDIDGSIVNWTWNFGDGNHSYTQNPMHQYAYHTTYTIILNVTDSNGVKNETGHQIIVRNAPPTINFTYTPLLPTIYDIVTFNGTSVDLDGTIVNWTWEFDDGLDVNYTCNTTYQFNENRTYNVTLNVTDDDGDWSTLTKHVVMKEVYTNTTLAGNETIIDLHNEFDINVTINTTSSIWVNISKYSGNPIGENITHNITALGKYYEISVQNESLIQWPINITIFYTQDDLNNSGLNESQLPGVYFWNATSGEWELYDDTGVNTTYNQSGCEGYCWVNAWHLTNFTAGGDNETPSKVTGLTVTDAKDGKLNLAWTAATDNVAVDHYRIYRDNAPLINISSPTISHQDTGLTNGHSYMYNVSAVDGSGNEGIRSDPISGTPTASGGGGNPPGDGGAPPMMGGSSNDPPIANLSAGKPYVGFAGSPVTFDASWSNDTDGNITKWVWNFGDGANASGKIVTHIYSKLGVYTVTLTVTDNENDTDSDTATVVIRVQNKSPSNPTIDGLTAGHKNVNYSYTVKSTDANNDTIKYTFHWNDGTVESSEFLPNGTSWTRNHSWAAARKYTLQVTATDNQTNSSSEKTIWIDTISVTNIGYLIDIDGDGTYDSFHNETNGKETSLGLKAGDYLIDSDGDGKWDYAFNAIKGLTSYQPPKTPGFELVFFLGAIAVSILLWKKKKIV